ncbi:hypothetical protein DL95DRAFT_241334, partial [Leptodontidium sp. 2 PMI_412]
DSLVAVIGVGYVGTHLASAFAQQYNVLAFDVSERRLCEVAKEFKNLPVRCTSSAADLSEADYFLISVPTVLNQDKTINTTYLQSAVASVERYARPGSTVVVESSVAVGMTRKLLGPLISSKRLKVGMSPERVDPGRVFPAFKDIPKVISGLDSASLESIHELYGRVFKTIVSVSSPEAAEMTKLYENCQRMICAAYANEMADACNTLGIDAWEVSRAAASKPFGYLPFRPGPGIGGHCIPVNPYYLLSTCSMPILQHATETSWRRPADLADRFMRSILTMDQKTSTPEARRTRILVVGVGFKRGQSVLSNSPGVAIIVALMSDWDVYVEFADPLVSSDALSYIPKMDTDKNWRAEHLATFDGIIVAVDQVGLDLAMLKTLPGVIVQNYCPAVS